VDVAGKICSERDCSGDAQMQKERSGDWSAKGFTLELDCLPHYQAHFSGYFAAPFEGAFWIGCVTILMFVMPACFTASMTEANAPNGTRSSAST
jgi:hypothetical protein